MLTAAPSAAPRKADGGSAYDFEFAGIDGRPLKLATWRGKGLLVVNTASYCGYTKQYAALEQLWTTYKKAGLIVLCVPSNDFGGQEPKDETEIQSFCERTFGVTFPLTAKQHVVGPDAHPFYKWAAAIMGSSGVPNWNFHKYLVGRDGHLLRAFSTRVEPTSPEVTEWIGKALAHSSVRPSGGE